MRRIHDMQPAQRPRERLLVDGPEVLSDAELLAVLLRSGRRGCSAVDEAHHLLADTGGLAEVARLEAVELLNRPGFGPAKASALIAAIELAGRVANAELKSAVRLDQPAAVGDLLVRRLKSERREVFGFIAVDHRHRFLECRELSRGTRREALVDPAELFRAAMLDDAAAVLIFHNHPSGDLEPSAHDLGLTSRLVTAGSVVGISVLDHLIVAGARWLSLRTTRPGLFVVGTDSS